MRKKKKKNCVMLLPEGGVYVPMGIFPNINMHKNIYCHLKI